MNFNVTTKVVKTAIILWMAIVTTTIYAQTPEVGTLPGSFSVSPSGAATYAIPIDLPPGRAGMTPSLALTYNSQGGNGLLGIGWTLSGLSTITRTGTTIYHDEEIDGVDFDGNDQFMLDGSRLIVIGENSGNIEYRTELETYSKIIGHGASYNDHTYFTVYTKDGRILEYGKEYDNNNARINAQNRSEGLFWHLNRVSDRKGNYIDFIYHEHLGYGKISKIEYTGNSETYDDPYYSVSFHYITGREDVIKKYISGCAVEVNVQLKVIEIKYQEEELKTYELNYDNTNNIYTHLTNVQLTSNGKVLNPNVFEWGGINHDVFEEQLPYNYVGTDKYFIDYNADGRTDMIELYWNLDNNKKKYYDWKYRKRLENGFSTQYSFSTDINEYIHTLLVGDYNGDGYPDFQVLSYQDQLMERIEGRKLLLGKANGFSEIDLRGPFQMDNGEDNEPDFGVGDFDGDGISELIVVDKHHNPGNDNCFIYKLHESEASHNLLFSTELNFGNTDFHNAKLIVGDFNGDGRSDIMRTAEFGSSGGGHSSDCFLYEVDISNQQLQWIYNAGFPTTWHRIFPGDFNGDGITDILTYVPDNPEGGWVISCFNGKNSWNLFETPPIASFDPYDELDQYDHGISLADFNGDGLTDIAEFEKEINPQTYADYYIYCSNGHKLETDNPITGQIQCIGGLNFFGGGYPIKHLYQHFNVDFNGDGKSDLYKASGYDDDHTYLFDYNNEYNLLQTITNGFGVKTNITYKPLTYKYIYEKGSGAEYPITDIQAPLYVVSSITPDEDLGQNIQTEYYYKGAKVHKHGKGFLGFEQTIVTNKLNKTITISDYSIYTKEINQKEYYFYPYISKATVKTLSGTTLSISENEMDVKINNTDNFIYSPVVTKSLSRIWDLDGSFVKSVKSTQSLWQIDEYGNSSYSLILTDPDNLSLTTPDNQFDFKKVFGASFRVNIDVQNWLISRPSASYGFSHDKNDPDEFSFFTEYKYYIEEEEQSNGIEPWPSLKSQKTYPERLGISELTTQTEYEYDVFGHITKETLSAPYANPSLYDRITEYEYDTQTPGYDGRFLTQVKNTIGGIAYKTIFEYYLDNGKLYTETDPSRLVTTYYYDGFDKLKNVQYPDEIVKRIDYMWPGESGMTLPANAAFCSLNWKIGESPLYTVYDKFEREIMGIAFGLNEQDKICVKNVFDEDDGKLEKVSEPYFINGSPTQWTTFNYDELGRVELKTTPANSYTYDYSGRTTTTTNNGTQVAVTKTVNAIGNPTNITDPTGTITYEYYSSGNVKQIDALGAITTMQYDDVGNQTQLSEPNAGITSYVYNAYGELTEQTDANGNKYQMDYDVFGRLITKTLANAGEQTIYDYIDVPNLELPGMGFGRLSSITGSNNIAYYYQYDRFNRLKKKTEVIEGQNYEEYYSYNTHGKPDTYTYPTGFKVGYDYALNGMLTKVTDVEEGILLWEALQVNQRGQVTYCAVGNGNSVGKTYDDYGMPASITTYNPGPEYDYSTGFTFDPITGNLMQRSASYGNVSLSENFAYDDYSLKNRLIEWGENSDQKYHTLYAANGNILGKTDATVNSPNCYNYSSIRPHAVTDIVNPTTEYMAIANIPQNITYNAFNKVETMVQIIKSNDPNGSEETRYGLDIVYGPDNLRKKVTHTKDRGILKTKYYIGSNYEIEVDGNGNQRKLHYLSGGDGVFAIYVKNMQQDSMYYIHKDYLGSIEMVTDENGYVKSRQSFDPWGRKRNPQNWTYESSPWTDLFDRGFTGHEHLDNFNLINMNARLYDPWLGRFLQPDPFVQAPTYSQNFNRYSYAWNNPLIFSDPSGEIVWAPIIIGAVIGTYMGGTLANDDYNPVNWNYSSGTTWGYMAGGAIVGGLSGYVGGAIAAAEIPMANTLGIAGASLTNSIGTNIYTGGQTDISVSLGVASYNFSSGDWGYLGKSGNSTFENIGYGLGALANLGDAFSLFSGGGQNVSANSASTKNDWWGHHSLTDENRNTLVSVGPNSPVETVNPLTGDKHSLSQIYKNSIKGADLNWDSYVNDAGTWKVQLNNVSKSILSKYSSSRWDLVLNSCTSHSAKALWMAGVPNLFGFHPHLLNAQLLIRQIGIYSSPYLYQIP